MTIAIIGGSRECGRTTFLGLLYESALIKSTKEAESDKFRFTPLDNNSLRSLSLIRQQMENGEFPIKTFGSTITDIHFRMGFKKRFKERFHTIDFSVYDLAGEDIEEFVDGGMKGNDVLERLFSSNVAIFLIDCHKLTLYSGNSQYQMMYQDKQISEKIRVFCDFKKRMNSRTHSRRTSFFTILVFTKFDSMDPDILARCNLSRFPPSIREKKNRSIYFNALISNLLPISRDILVAEKLLRRSKCFYSSVNLEMNDNMPLIENGRFKIQRRRRERHGITICFSEIEYLDLIDHIGSIANNYYDGLVEPSEISD